MQWFTNASGVQKLFATTVCMFYTSTKGTIWRGRGYIRYIHSMVLNSHITTSTMRDTIVFKNVLNCNKQESLDNITNIFLHPSVDQLSSSSSSSQALLPADSQQPTCNWLLSLLSWVCERPAIAVLKVPYIPDCFLTSNSSELFSPDFIARIFRSLLKATLWT